LIKIVRIQHYERCADCVQLAKYELIIGVDFSVRLCEHCLQELREKEISDE
jgi:hypothetical protein